MISDFSKCCEMYNFDPAKANPGLWKGAHDTLRRAKVVHEEASFIVLFEAKSSKAKKKDALSKKLDELDAEVKERMHPVVLKEAAAISGKKL